MQQLLQTEARFRALIENSNDLIAVVDAHGRMLYSNQIAQRLFEAWETRPIGELLSQSVDPVDAPQLLAALREVRNQPGARRSIARCRIRGRDGLWHTWSGVIANLLNDPAVNGIVVNAHDITLQHEAQATLERLFIAEQRHARELAALHTAFRTMSSSLELKQVLAATIAELQRLIGAESASVLLRDGAELRFAAVSGPGAEALLGTRMPADAGFAGATLATQTATLVVEAQDDGRFFDAIDRQTGQTTHALIAVPLIVNDRSIGVMEAINKAASGFDAHDLDLMQAMAGSAAIAIENARMYEALRDQAQRLQAAQPKLIQTEKMAALGRLTASLAHEINNPLQVVQGCLSLIRETVDDQVSVADTRWTATRQDLAVAATEVERLGALVQRLHDFYRPTLTPTTTLDVHALIAHVLALTEQQLVENHITIDLALAPAPSRLRVIANPDHLAQVLLNLILSAVDAMPGGGHVSIRTALDDQPADDPAIAPQRVRIDLSDTGPDIPAALLPYVFEPFYAVRPNDSSLSLSICYELVTSIGGEIAVANRPDGGSTFTLWLPIDLST